MGKACCAARARLPWLLCRRRTVRGVAYFDLITDDGRLFFGNSFHCGFFADGRAACWAGLAIAAVVLVFLLVFILENGQSASIGYFGAHGHLPLGVALLLAAVGGALLVIIPGTSQMVQLRLAARRHRRLDARPAAQRPAPASAPPPARRRIPAEHRSARCCTGQLADS